MSDFAQGCFSVTVYRKRSAALAKHKTFIRAEIAQTVNLKYAPDLRFLRDQSFAETERIERLLASDKVKRDLQS